MGTRGGWLRCFLCENGALHAQGHIATGGIVCRRAGSFLRPDPTFMTYLCWPAHSIVLTFDHTRALYRVLYILLFSFGWSRAVRPIEPD